MYQVGELEAKFFNTTLAKLNCVPQPEHRPRSSHLLEPRERGPSILNPKNEIIPYRLKLKCQICEGVFPSHYAFTKHYLLKHKAVAEEDLPKYELKNALKCKICKSKKRGYGYDPETPINRFDYVIINGEYIEKRMNKCKTENINFNPSRNFYKILEQYDNPAEIEKKASITIKQKCNIRICPKCSFSRFIKYFDNHLPFVKTFKQPKLLCLEVKKHSPLSLTYKKELEQNLRNFWRNLEYNLQNNPEDFLTKKFKKRLRRAGGEKLVEKKINEYRNYEIQYLCALSLKDTGDPNGYYWHFHAVVDMPYIDKEKLSEFWQKQVGSSLDIRAVKFSKNQRKNFEKNEFWKKIKKRHPQTDRNALRTLYYVVKYVVEMESWLSPDQYARFGYGKCFVEQSHKDRGKTSSTTKLGHKGNILPKKIKEKRKKSTNSKPKPKNSRSKPKLGKKPPPKSQKKPDPARSCLANKLAHKKRLTKKIKVETGEILEVPLAFSKTEPILSKPAPSIKGCCPKGGIGLLLSLIQLREELKAKKSLPVSYVMKKWNRKVIEKMLQKGDLIKSGSKIYAGKGRSWAS